MNMILKIKRYISGLKLSSRLGYVPSREAFGKMDLTSHISAPTTLANPSHIFIDENCSIDKNSVLLATNCKIFIKKYFVASTGLHISTGSHERRVGMFLGQITESIKNHNIGLDADVVIEEDVWASFNVSIMAGVTVARGCTLAAGAVVTRSTTPYSIWGGVPARHIKFYWTIDQILEHESILYDESERYSRDELVQIFEQYQ